MASPKILVVEDDLHTRNIIEMVLKRDRMLRYHQLEVICAGDGEEGLQLFRQHAPDVLITDLLMPKMDGFELVKAVRASDIKGDLPILATSAIVRDKSVLRRLERDYDVELQLKPFSPKVFASRVRKILQGLSGGARAGEGFGPKGRPDRAGSSADLTEDASLGDAGPGGDDSAQSSTTPPRPSKQVGGAAATAEQVDGRLVALGGDLAQTPLARVLLDAFENQWSGILEVTRGQQVRKLIHLLGGYPIFVRSNLRTETLGQLLVRRGGLSEAQHQQVIRLAQEAPLPYGEALVRLKLMSEEEVMAELVAQTRYKVQNCLRWRDGRWSFAEDPEVGARVPRCTVDPLDVVFAGLRRHHSVEEAISLLRGGQDSRSHIVKLPRFDHYRERFAESFGWDLIELIGTGCSLSRLSESRGKQALAVQLDVMLQIGMVELRRRPSHRAGREDERGADALMRDPMPGGGIAHAESSSPPESSPNGDVLSLKNLAAPAVRIPDAAGSQSPVGARAVPSPRRRPETPEVRMARQLIEATYLGLHEKTHYEVLGVIPGTNAAGIEVAYHIKRKQFALERFRGMDLGLAYGHLEEICAALDAAFEVLQDPMARQAYNEDLLQRGSEERDRALRAEELFRAGCEMLEQGRYDDALYALEQATQLDGQAEYRVQEALAFFLAHGQSPAAASEAMMRVQAALADEPQQPRAHLVAARISCAAGAVDEAISHIQNAIQIDATFSEAFDELERLLLGAQQVERLEEEYRRVIFLVGSKDRGWAAELWRRLSRLYRDRLGDEQRSYIAAQAALKLDPDDSGLRAALADADSRHPARWPDAVRGYRSLLRHEPGNRSAVHRIYDLHQKAGREDAAFLAASAAMLRGVADGQQLRMVDTHGCKGVPRGTSVVTEQLIRTLRHPEEDHASSALFARLSPLMARLHPMLPEQLGAASDATGMPTPPGLFAELLSYVCFRLGVDTPILRLRDTDDVWLGLSGTSEPALLVTTDALLIPDERDLCFRLARALAPLRTQSLVARVSGVGLLSDYLLAAVTLLAPDRDLPPQTPRMVRIQRELQRDSELLHSCGASVAALIERGDEGLSPERWLEATRRSGERLGLALCADLIVAGRIVGERSSDAQADLIDFALSEEHEKLRQDLGTAIR